jgi:hypothetical protein
MGIEISKNNIRIPGVDIFRDRRGDVKTQT